MNKQVMERQAELAVWASNAQPGEEYVYLRNATSAGAGIGRKPEAQAAWNLHLAGIVTLAQRRRSHGTKDAGGTFDYLAIRTREGM